MSLFTFIADLRGLRHEAKRIADALDRAYPPPTSEAAVPSGEMDVSYASDEATERQVLLEEAARHGFKFDEAGNLIEMDATDASEEEPSTHHES